jgi:hypothetical protein
MHTSLLQPWCRRFARTAPVYLFPSELILLPYPFYSRKPNKRHKSLLEVAASSTALSIAPAASQNLAPWEYNFESTVVHNERTMKATARKIAEVAVRRRR